MLVPWRNDIEQFYDIERSVHYDYDYKPQPMDIIFISYDEPSAEKRFNIENGINKRATKNPATSSITTLGGSSELKIFIE